jgi:hypothetical protein
MDTTSPSTSLLQQGALKEQQNESDELNKNTGELYDSRDRWRQAMALQEKDSLKAAQEKAWDFMNTVAFWASIFFIQGAVLFTIGSICLYPGIIPSNAPDYIAIAWIDYTFMIGSWCFTIGNYLVYFQVINASQRAQLLGVDTRKDTQWIACPRRESGHLGALCNCIGALLFNVNTMTMFAPVLKVSNHGFNVWYVSTGAAGSLCFVVGAIFEGEHNDWRAIFCTFRRWKELPFLMSVLNFLGGLLFFVAYVVDFDRRAESLCKSGSCLLTIHGVAGTFTVGSIFFVISSWMSLWMWKSQSFGLSFGKTVVGLVDQKEIKVDLKQQLILIVYCANVTMMWVKVGCLLANVDAWTDAFLFFHDTTLKLLTYFCILFLASGECFCFSIYISFHVLLLFCLLKCFHF